jgi:hypothetical protein
MLGFLPTEVKYEDGLGDFVGADARAGGDFHWWPFSRKLRISVSYVIRERMREMGTPVALGASTGNILWMVMKQGIRSSVPCTRSVGLLTSGFPLVTDINTPAPLGKQGI